MSIVSVIKKSFQPRLNIDRNHIIKLDFNVTPKKSQFIFMSLLTSNYSYKKNNFQSKCFCSRILSITNLISTKRDL